MKRIIGGRLRRLGPFHDINDNGDDDGKWNSLQIEDQPRGEDAQNFSVDGFCVEQEKG